MFYRKSELKRNKEKKKGKDRPFLDEVFQFPFNTPWRHQIRIANSHLRDDFPELGKNTA